MPIFLTFLNTRILLGAYNQADAPGITRPLYAPAMRFSWWNNAVVPYYSIDVRLLSARYPIMCPWKPCFCQSIKGAVSVPTEKSFDGSKQASSRLAWNLHNIYASFVNHEQNITLKILQMLRSGTTLMKIVNCSVLVTSFMLSRATE